MAKIACKELGYNSYQSYQVVECPGSTTDFCN